MWREPVVLGMFSIGTRSTATAQSLTAIWSLSNDWKLLGGVLDHVITVTANHSDHPSRS